MINLFNINQELVNANYRLYSYWSEHLFLTLNWWVMLGLFVIPWILLFFVIRNKQVSNNLITPILFCILFAFFIDYLCVSYGIWYYTAKLTPLSIDVPWDFTLTPTVVTFLLIIKPKIHPLVKGIMLGLIVAFVAEPLFEFFGFYVYLKWKYIYSFPLYLFLYLVSHKLYYLGQSHRDVN